MGQSIFMTDIDCFVKYLFQKQDRLMQILILKMKKNIHQMNEVNKVTCVYLRIVVQGTEDCDIKNL